MLAAFDPCFGFGFPCNGNFFEKMLSEEADEDDIWFGPDFRLNESQELEYIGDDYSKDGIVEEAVVVGERREACIIPESQQENPQPTENNENLDLKPKAKRNTMVYSQKKLLAKLDLFLDPLYHDKFTDVSAEVIGQVKECPREVNGKQYRIEWKNDGKPLPTGLERTWLRCYLPSTKDYRMLLQAAILAYDEWDEKQPARPSEQRKPRGVPFKKASKAKLATLPVVITTTQTKKMDALAATASVRTSSTISSLSQSTIASPEVVTGTRGTRSSMMLESSSDDGDDLDEEDNMYNVEASVSENSDAEDSADDNTVSVSANENQWGISKLLEDIHWDFCCEAHVEDNDAPSPYIGPSGLKPRVAQSFSTPFECLAICGGLDYDMVCRLARNSNEYTGQKGRTWQV
jgi:hypothetical protein